MFWVHKEGYDSCFGSTRKGTIHVLGSPGRVRFMFWFHKAGLDSCFGFINKGQIHQNIRSRQPINTTHQHNPSTQPSQNNPSTQPIVCTSLSFTTHQHNSSVNITYPKSCRSSYAVVAFKWVSITEVSLSSYLAQIVIYMWKTLRYSTCCWLFRV